MNKSKVRILIVDDEKSILDALKTHLELDGYTVETADSADLAIEMFSKHPFQVVLTDINMPVKDGLALLEEIRHIRSDTMVIMITGYTSLTKVFMSRVHGAFDYVLKPFKDLGEIDSSLERAVTIISRWELILEETRQRKKEAIL